MLRKINKQIQMKNNTKLQFRVFVLVLFLIILSIFFLKPKFLGLAVQEQNNESSAMTQAVEQPGINAWNLQAAEDASGTISGSFMIKNKARTIRSDIHIIAEIISIDEMEAFDRELLDNNIVLGPEEISTINFNYVPDVRLGGDYKLWLSFVEKSGRRIGWTLAKITLNGNQQILSLSNPEVRVEGINRAIGANEGISFQSGKKAELVVTVANNGNTIIVAKPQIRVWVFNMLSNPISTVDGEKETFLPGQNVTRHYSIPEMGKPDVYSAELRFFDDNGKAISGFTTYRWILSGPTARILSVTGGEAGVISPEGLLLHVEIGGPFDVVLNGAKLVWDVLDSAGKVIDNGNVDLPPLRNNVILQDIIVTSPKVIRNPSFHFKVIDKDDAVLASYETTVLSAKGTYKKKPIRLYLTIGILLVMIALLVILFIRRRRGKKSIMTKTLLVIGIALTISLLEAGTVGAQRIRCTNECLSSGARQCSGTNAYKICGNYDSDSCLEWSSTTSCPSCQSCSGGSCTNTCSGTDTSCGCNSCANCNSQDSYVGSKFCSGSDVYLTYRNYYCSGTSCAYSDTNNLIQSCGSNYCDAFGSNYCNGGNVYHSRTCYNRGCSGGSCYSNSYTDEQLIQSCGSNYCDAWGSNYCKDNNVYHSRTCYNRGCSGGSCYSNSYTDEQLVQSCSSGQTCSNGRCVCVPATCSSLGKSCGNWPDGCGGTLNCGTCASFIPTSYTLDITNFKLYKDARYTQEFPFDGTKYLVDLPAGSIVYLKYDITSGACENSYTYDASVIYIDQRGLETQSENSLSGFADNNNRPIHTSSWNTDCPGIGSTCDAHNPPQECKYSESSITYGFVEDNWHGGDNDGNGCYVDPEITDSDRDYNTKASSRLLIGGYFLKIAHTRGGRTAETGTQPSTVHADIEIPSGLEERDNHFLALKVYSATAHWSVGSWDYYWREGGPEYIGSIPTGADPDAIVHFDYRVPVITTCEGGYSPGQSRSCGSCGTQTCQSDGSWSLCTGDTSKTQPCKTSEDCDGTQTCGSDGNWGSCDDNSGDNCPVVCTSNEVGLCTDGLDNDCDGLIDSADSDCCIPSTEICDNIDNDCDLSTDEDLSQTISCGTGACYRTVTQTCSSGSWSPACTPGSPTTEICDNKDNDCDGSIDESLSQSCGCGGTQTCASGQWGTCTGEITKETSCTDSLDNDCDGSTDCADSDCAGKTGPNNALCCQSASNCVQDDCVIESCTNNVCGYSNRNACDSTECSAGTYCDSAGGNCASADNSNYVCLNCVSDQTAGLPWTWTPSNHQDAGKGFGGNLFNSQGACTPASGGNCFDNTGNTAVHKAPLTTGNCCGDDANEFYKPDYYGPECTNDVNDCVWSTGDAQASNQGNAQWWCYQHEWSECIDSSIGTKFGGVCCAGVDGNNAWTPNALIKTENQYSCSDGIDNDCDGKIDTQDPDCCTNIARECKEYTKEEFEEIHKSYYKNKDTTYYNSILSQIIGSKYYACQPDPSDIACCQNPNSCVYNRRCYEDKAKPGDIDNDGVREVCVASSPGQFIDEFETNCINGIDDDFDGLTDCQDSDCDGSITGTVKNVNEQGISLADINLKQDLTTVKSTTTNQQGSYTLSSVNCGTYNLVASHADYAPQTKSNLNVPPKTQITADFSLVLGTSCEQDCTFAADNIVHASCDGKNGCSFYDSISKAACDFSQPGWVRDYNTTHYVTCASGSPQPKIEILASVSCASGTLVKVTRIVVYNGKPVKLVVAACG